MASAHLSDTARHRDWLDRQIKARKPKAAPVRAHRTIATLTSETAMKAGLTFDVTAVGERSLFVDLIDDGAIVTPGDEDGALVSLWLTRDDAFALAGEILGALGLTLDASKPWDEGRF